MNKKIFLALVMGLSSCATYHAQPLPAQPTVLRSYSEIVVDRDRISLPNLSAHEIDTRNGLDMDAIAILAVINNPDLKIARDDAHVAQAQAFAAGLLPDPQIAVTHDFDQNPPPGATTPFSIGLSEDIGALIQHYFTTKSSRYDSRKTDLNLLWQEWQVVSQARTLFVRIVKEAQQMRVLQQNRELLANRNRNMQIALDQGLLARDTITPYLVALQDLDRQIRDLERQLNTDRHGLNAFLGLSPEADVPLQETVDIPAVDDKEIVAGLSDLASRRPDLLALQSGYAAQDQRYRAAIAGQFPNLTVGVTRARDNASVYSNGFGLTLNLPIFNRNRGNIAIEQATRQKLYDDYQNRLSTADSDVHRILAEQRINMKQLQDVEGAISDLSGIAAKADQAMQAHEIDASTYVALQASYLSKQLEKIGIEQSILLQRVALQALVGGELPVKHNQKSES